MGDLRLLEVPVLVFGDDGIADHIQGTRAGEEVVVQIAYLVRGSKAALAAKIYYGYFH
jgi:hypothetical protein